MDISKTLEILKKLGLPAELLDRLKAAANNIPADMLPNTLDMNAPESIQKYVSLNLFLNNLDF